MSILPHSLRSRLRQSRKTVDVPFANVNTSRHVRRWLWTTCAWLECYRFLLSLRICSAIIVFAEPLNRNDPEECCDRPPHLKNPYCNEILIPEDDYFYRLFNVQCMNFVRAFPAVRPGCRLGSRVPFNLLTGVLDGNTVYGITETFAR